MKGWKKKEEKKSSVHHLHIGVFEAVEMDDIA